MGTTNLGSTKYGCKKMLGPRNVPTNFWFQKSFGQSLSKKIKAFKILAPKKFVKIRSVTAETFLIWTNIARTNVAWINVTMTLGISKRWSQEPTFQVWSKCVQ